jgi:hypothetical protein
MMSLSCSAMNRLSSGESRADQAAQQLVEARTELVGEKIAGELAWQQLLDEQQRPASPVSPDNPKLERPRRRWWRWRR